MIFAESVAENNYGVFSFFIKIVGDLFFVPIISIFFIYFLLDFNGGIELDGQFLINIGAGIVVASLSFLSGKLWSIISSLKNDVHSVQLDIAKNYIRKDDLEKIEKTLEKILDRLDNKADK